MSRSIEYDTKRKDATRKKSLVTEVSARAWKRCLDRETPIDWQNGTAAETLNIYLNEFIARYRDCKDLLRFNQFFNVYVQREGVLPDVMKPSFNAIDTVASMFHRIFEILLKDMFYSKFTVRKDGT